MNDPVAHSYVRWSRSTPERPVQKRVGESMCLRGPVNGSLNVVTGSVRDLAIPHFFLSFLRMRVSFRNGKVDYDISYNSLSGRFRCSSPGDIHPEPSCGCYLEKGGATRYPGEDTVVRFAAFSRLEILACVPPRSDVT